jgi:integrase
MEQNISINFIMEGTKPKKDGSYPIKLNLYSSILGQKRYGIKISATKEQWQKINAPKLREPSLKELKIKLDGIKNDAHQIIDSLQVFSFVAFEEAFFNRSTHSKLNTLEDWFRNHIDDLKANGQIGTAQSYKTTFNSLNNFRKNLSVYDITPHFLKLYEKHLTSLGRSVSTVGIYMRQLRTIINQAIAQKILSTEDYPFKLYKIPAGRNIKKALDNFEVKMILNYSPENIYSKKAVDFWILSYLCNGMNFADIVNLKKSDYHQTYLTFIREKTKLTKKKDLTPIKVALNDRAISIIEHYKDTESDNPYLFPILQKDINPITARNRKMRFIKYVNKGMKGIGDELGIKKPVYTYAARHSFSSVLMRKGAPTAYIKEALGHSSVTVTENYLASFADETKIEYAKMLTDI